MTRETSEILPLAQTFQFNCDKNILKTLYFVASRGENKLFIGRRLVTSLCYNFVFASNKIQRHITREILDTALAIRTIRKNVNRHDKTYILSTEDGSLLQTDPGSGLPVLARPLDAAGAEGRGEGLRARGRGEGGAGGVAGLRGGGGEGGAVTGPGLGVSELVSHLMLLHVSLNTGVSYKHRNTQQSALNLPLF